MAARGGEVIFLREAVTIILAIGKRARNDARIKQRRDFIEAPLAIRGEIKKKGSRE